MMQAATLPLNIPQIFSSIFFCSTKPLILNPSNRSYLLFPRSLPPIRASIAMETAQSGGSGPAMKLLFVEMGVGYDQHGQDVTSAAMRACRDAISSNSIPAFRRGNIPGVSFDQMKLHIKLGVPQRLQQSLNMDKVKSVFPYGKILDVEVVDGGMICSSGVLVEEMGDKNDDCTNEGNLEKRTQTVPDVMINSDDSEHIAFITNKGTFCYKIRETVEDYVDDIVVKSKKQSDHTRYLREVFDALRKYGSLNPDKRVFGVTEGKFLGF
ncbi:hypothetical protein V2J09_011154 [Rumex salicifolius]